MDIVVKKSSITPFTENVEIKYEPEKEPIREQKYKTAKALNKIKRRNQQVKKGKKVSICVKVQDIRYTFARPGNIRIVSQPKSW